MIIINAGDLDNSLRLTAVACLNDNVRVFYTSTHGEIISGNDKSFLKDNIIDSITLTMGIKPISQTYQQILSTIVGIDYPERWGNLPQMAKEKLLACQRSEDLYGSILAIQTLVRYTHPDQGLLPQD